MYNLFFLLALGLFKGLDPNHFSQFTQFISRTEKPPNLLGSAGSRAFLLTFFAGGAASTVWYLIGWGAYRELNALGEERSAYALGIFGFLFIAAFAVCSLIIAGISPS